MTKNCLILPYFGVLPNYFDLFLNSCTYNKEFDFLIFTDQEVKVEASNIQVVKTAWGDFVSFIKYRLGEDMCLDKPYKLCDYRPAYGYVFADYLKEYDYWGHCDCDLIFGDLSMLNPYFEKGYDKIGEYGHLVFYKNNEIVSNYFRTLKDTSVPSWDVVSKSPKSYGFDEFGGMYALCASNNINKISPRLFDDIIFYKENFYTRRLIEKDVDPVNIPTYFEFDEGRLYRWYYYNKKWEKDESLYVHFQKRRLEVCTKGKNHFIVVPNEIVDVSRYDKDTLVKKCSAPWLDINDIKIKIKFNAKKILTFLKNNNGNKHSIFF